MAAFPCHLPKSGQTAFGQKLSGRFRASDAAKRTHRPAGGPFSYPILGMPA